MTLIGKLPNLVLRPLRAKGALPSPRVAEEREKDEELKEMISIDTPKTKRREASENQGTNFGTFLEPRRSGKRRTMRGKPNERIRHLPPAVHAIIDLDVKTALAMLSLLKAGPTGERLNVNGRLFASAPRTYWRNKTEQKPWFVPEMQHFFTSPRCHRREKRRTPVSVSDRRAVSNQTKERAKTGRER